MVLEYPAGKAPNPPGESLYVKMVAAYAKDSESKVRKRGPKTIASRGGFEAVTDDGKGKVNHLVTIVPAGDRIYMLVSAGPRGHATSGDAEHFRNSFHVTDGGPGNHRKHVHHGHAHTPLALTSGQDLAWRRGSRL